MILPRGLTRRSPEQPSAIGIVLGIVPGIVFGFVLGIVVGFVVGFATPGLRLSE
jgi:hypothetical protein